MKKKNPKCFQLVLLVEECGEEATQCTPQPTGRTTASRTLPKSERGPHAARDPRCAGGSPPRVRAPGAAGAGSRPAHSSARRPPEGPAGPRPSRSRGTVAWGRGVGLVARPTRRSPLPDAEQEGALTASGSGGGRGSRRGRGARREARGRRGAGASGPGAGMLGPTGAPNPSPAASPRTPAGPEPATPPPSGCTRPRGHEPVGQPWRGRSSWRASGRLARQSRSGASGCPPRPLPSGPAPSARAACPGRLPRPLAGRFLSTPKARRARTAWRGRE